MKICARFRAYLVVSCIFLTTGCGGGGGSYTSTVTNLPPSFSPASTSFSVAENQTAVTTVSASDPEGDNLTYGLYGTDASALSISSTGGITFNTAPDYETKASYSVIVNVRDGVNNATPVTLTISITDVAEVWLQKGADIDGAVGDQTGYSTSLSSDGTVVAIGAPYSDGNENDSGHVRIYQ